MTFGMYSNNGNSNHGNNNKQLNNNNLNMMKIVATAFGKGQESKEYEGFSMYQGIAPFFVRAINPDINELQKLYPGRDFSENPPKYDYERTNEDGTVTKGTFVTIYLQSNVEHVESNGIDTIVRASYLMMPEVNFNKDKTKHQVINAYGETGWVNAADFKNGILPEYMIKNGFLHDGMRPAFVGEEDLIKFLKTYIVIPNSKTYDRETKTWTLKTDAALKEALAGFSIADLKKIVQGDVSVIRNAVKYQPNNQIKFLLSVKQSADKEYQDVWTRYPIPFNWSKKNYEKVQTELTKALDAGAFASNIFNDYPFTFQKYEVKPSTFAQEADEAFENPFGEVVDDTFGMVAPTQAPVASEQPVNDVGMTDVDPFAGF